SLSSHTCRHTPHSQCTSSVTATSFLSSCRAYRALHSFPTRRSSDLYYGAGNEQRLHQAEALLVRTLAVEPRHLVSLKARAALLRAQGKFEDGIAAAQAVIAENPGEPWAYKEVGLSTMYVGEPAEALDWFTKAERLGPRDPGRWTGWMVGDMLSSCWGAMRRQPNLCAPPSIRIQITSAPTRCSRRPTR